MISRNPRIATAMAYETGMRSQAAADLFEMANGGKKSATVRGIETRAKTPGTGADVNAEYWAVYSVVERMKRESPTMAAIAITLAPVDEAERNWHRDDVADTLLTRYRLLEPAYADWQKRKKAKLTALAHARVEHDMRNVDGSRPEPSQANICGYCANWHGQPINAGHWRRDGWDVVWDQLGDIMMLMESEAYLPISKVIRDKNLAISKQVA